MTDAERQAAWSAWATELEITAEERTEIDRAIREHPNQSHVGVFMAMEAGGSKIPRLSEKVMAIMEGLA